MGLTRRAFLNRVGQAGGFSAAYITMQSMGLIGSKATAAVPLAVAPGAGNGISVAILGGGISGLVAAYELKALGYHCTVLEARERPGGRNWSVRGGDKVTFLDGTTQTCSWDPGHYQNVGPARLPSAHTNMLGYCRKLGVALEVEVNTSRYSYLQNDDANGGKPELQRRVINDTRGHISELLSKCIKQGALDQEMTKEDRDRTLAFLRQYGALRADAYKGSSRSGYSILPGAGDQTGTINEPIDMHTLLDENFWSGILFEETFDMQATMFQPVGGIDRIPYAFAKALGDTIQFGSPVSEIRKTEKGVRIGYTQKGMQKTLEADYCMCAMPLTILKKTPNDFSAPYKDLIERSAYSTSYKLAWESRRFWEQDYNIYGGLEFVNKGPSPVWFPSAGLFTQRGVLLSGYTAELGDFAQLSMEQKFVASRQTIEKLHPGHGKELEKPILVSWAKIPYNEGSWISGFSQGRRGDGEGQPAPEYETLIQPDGPIYFIGDHASHIVAWQEGAATSALRAVQMLSDRVKAKKA